LLRLLKKFGGPFFVMFLFAIVLLVARAGAELALPSFMQDIVDYGIAQGGIETPVPRGISTDSFGRVLGLLPAEHRDEFARLYPLRNEAHRTNLTDDVPRAVRNNDSIFPEMTPQNWRDMHLLIVAPTDVDEVLTGYIARALAQLQYGSVAFDDGLTTQLAKSFVRAEYARLGVDMGDFQLDYVFSVGLIMILVTLLSVTLAITQGTLSARIATGIGRRVRLAIFDKVVGFTNAEYNNFSTASLITRSTNDVQQVQGLIAMGIRIVIYSPIMAIGGVIMVMGSGAQMTWIVAATIGAMMAVFAIFIIIATPKFKVMQKLIDKVNLVTREGLTGMMVIRAFTTQEHEVKRFDDANSALKKVALFLVRMAAFQMPLISIILNFSTILIVWIGAGSVDAGYLAVGGIMAFIQYTMFVVWSFMMLAMIAIMLPRAQVSAKRIMEILNTEQVVNDPQNPAVLDKTRGDVEFRNVSFKFPGAEGYALEDISFTAQSGKMTAFVGSTGSGKSSVVNLVPRFYDVTDGEVLVGGVNVKNAAQADLRANIGYVPQKALLFSGTIESNIKYAGELVETDVMERAARIAQADAFIAERDGKYDEEIVQGGTNVSGGQRQRLAIARAVAKDPKIFIFDDSFSALDYKTDAQLRAALAAELGDATLLVVAQRIATIKNAEQIIVLDQGKIVGRGSHRDLLKTCEVYKQIASSQLSEEELADDLDTRTNGKSESGEVTS